MKKWSAFIFSVSVVLHSLCSAPLLSACERAAKMQPCCAMADNASNCCPQKSVPTCPLLSSSTPVTSAVLTDTPQIPTVLWKAVAFVFADPVSTPSTFETVFTECLRPPPLGADISLRAPPSVLA